MVFSISEFPANIYTFSTYGLEQASTISTPSSRMVFPHQVLLFQSFTNTVNINYSYTWTQFFPIYGIEYKRNIQN